MSKEDDSSDIINLTWHPLRRLGDFGSEEKKNTTSPSVYLWGFAHEQQFIPYVVGKSNRPLERAMQHYARFRGGEYAVYHRNALTCLSHAKKSKFDPATRCGLLYVPEGPQVLATRFLSDEVQKEVQYQLLAFRIAYAVVESETVSSTTITSIAEKTLAHDIGIHRLHSSVLGAGRLCRLKHGGNQETCQLLRQLILGE